MSERDSEGRRRDDVPGRRRSRLMRSAFGPAAIAMVIGVVLSLAGAVAVARWEQRVANAEFEGVAELGF